MTTENHVNQGKLVREFFFAFGGVKSPDYFLLVHTFKQSKNMISTPRRDNRNFTPASPALRLLQRKFSDANVSVHKEKSFFSIFVVIIWKSS